MKKQPIAVAVIIAVANVAFSGCGKPSTTPAPATHPAAQASSRPDGPSTMEPVLSAWQTGDRSAAIKLFVEADWTTRPLFAAGSTMGLSEKQFGALSREQQTKTSAELLEQSKGLKELVAAVRQAGRDAAAKRDIAQARNCFAAIQQCGEALDTPESTGLINLVGRAFKKSAETELAALGQ